MGAGKNREKNPAGRRRLWLGCAPSPLFCRAALRFCRSRVALCSRAVGRLGSRFALPARLAFFPPLLRRRVPRVLGNLGFPLLRSSSSRLSSCALVGRWFVLPPACAVAPRLAVLRCAGPLCGFLLSCSSVCGAPPPPWFALWRLAVRPSCGLPPAPSYGGCAFCGLLLKAKFAFST